MKTLLLIRHAKSSWDDFTLSDFERPLNDRGKKDAPEMADRLFKKNIEIDAFVSSPARRARKTAEEFAHRYGKKKHDLKLIDGLYHATEAEFLKAINELSNDWKTVAIFSHNPGITDFANRLTNNRIDNLPTTGIFGVKANTKHWNEFDEAQKEFLFFDFPKNK